jgi:hypothetical protein
MSLVSLVSLSQATDFTCGAGDVACLITAINTANANGKANTITLEAGTYTLTAVDNNTNGPNGLPSVTGIVTIKGAGADTTSLERDASAPAFRLGHVAATGNLTLDGLTLRGGRLFFDGGNLLNNGGTLTLMNTTLTLGITGTSGGGIFNQGGTVTLTTARLTHNVADAGGGLFTSGGTVLILKSIVDHNVAGHPGGGLFNENGGVLSLIHSTLTNNRGDTGGGLANRCGTAFSLRPGPCSTVTIIESTIADNGVETDGGGISNSGTLTLLNSTVASNRATNSGGIASHSAALLGGGIEAAMIAITTMITDNRTRSGGGGLSTLSGRAVMVNTILARNGTGLGSDCRGTVTSLGTNLIGDPTGCTITLQPSDLTGDPGLATFTDDGTPGNGHVPLLPTSQAIDAGNDAACPPPINWGNAGSAAATSERYGSSVVLLASTTTTRRRRPRRPSDQRQQQPVSTRDGPLGGGGVVLRSWGFLHIPQ